MAAVMIVVDVVGPVLVEALMRAWGTRDQDRRQDVDMDLKRFPPGYKGACVCDALVLPILFMFWYRASFSGVTSVAQGEVHHHPGLFVSTLMMIVVGRALLKVEKALRMPWAYSFDTVRAVRWYVLIIVMGLSIHLLSR